jgi:DNA replication protein DnaC
MATEPPIHQETCEICERPFEYQLNPDSEKLASSLPPSLARLMDRVRWVPIEHPACERIRQKREFEARESKRREGNIRTTRRLLRDFGFPQLLETKTFETFQVTRINQGAVTALKNWTIQPAGILLQGAPGRGKSHLMAAFVNQWAANGIPVAFQNVSDLMEILRKGFDDGSYQDRIQVLTSKGLQILVLDDLGAEQAKDWVREKLYQIIDARLRNQTPTFVTTNCTADELNQNLHPRITSRLIEACQWIVLEGEDYRHEIARQRLYQDAEAFRKRERPVSPRTPPTIPATQALDSNLIPTPDQTRDQAQATTLSESKRQALIQRQQQHDRELRQEQERLAQLEALRLKAEQAAAQAEREAEQREHEKREQVRAELEAQRRKERLQNAQRAPEPKPVDENQLPMPFAEDDRKALSKKLLDPFWF